MTDHNSHPAAERLKQVRHHMLSSPIAMGTQEILDGPFHELRFNTLYRLGSRHSMVMVEDAIGNHSLDVYEHLGPLIKAVHRSELFDEEDFATALVKTIEKFGGVLHSPTREEMHGVAITLWDQFNRSTHPTREDSLRQSGMERLFSPEKPLLGEVMAEQAHAAVIRNTTFTEEMAEELISNSRREIPAVLRSEANAAGRRNLAIAGAVAAVGAIMYLSARWKKHQEPKALSRD